MVAGTIGTAPPEGTVYANGAPAVGKLLATIVFTVLRRTSLNQSSPLFIDKEECSRAGVVVNVGNKERSADIAAGFVQPELGPRLAAPAW